jgi:hypothetical protein
MSTSSARPFRLLDALVLLVPMALSFALARNCLVHFWHPNVVRIWQGGTLRWAGLAVSLLSRFSGIAMLALLFMALRPPRLHVRRLSRQPGLVACAAAAAAMAPGAAIAIAITLFRHVPRWSPGNDFWPLAEARITPAVIAAWILLAATGRWRAEPTFIDRAGRALGAYWIALGLVRLVLSAFGLWLEDC